MIVGTSADHVSRATSLNQLNTLGGRVQLIGDIAQGEASCLGFNLTTYSGPGYNCKGYVWIGDQQIRALWDTGATRNTIDRDFLKKLMQDTKKKDSNSFL